jgi:dolichol-phosphate mannosyltransferase
MTVIAPFYNEEAGALAFYEALTATFQQKDIVLDMVFVDDGSHDKTLDILNTIADSDPRVTVLSFARNFGHQLALTAGMDYANGEVVVTMDSDLQHPPMIIHEMIAQYESGYDVVYAVRADYQKLSFFKKQTAKIYYGLLKRVANIEVIPGAADFRLMSRPAILAIRSMREQHRYLRGMAPWVGFRTTTVRFEQPERFAGNPSYSWRKSLRLARDGLFSFSTIPLELITWLGIALITLSALYFVYVLIIFLTGEASPGWTSVVVVLLALSGTQLVALGVIAQYVGMIFEQVKERPLYILKQERLSTPEKSRIADDTHKQSRTDT